MIDIHCHILPNIDDGARHMQESIAMAKAAVSQGIHTIIATPHHKNGKYNNPKQSVLADLFILNDRIQQEDIPLTILPGQEIRIHGELIEGIEKDDILMLNETSRYLFIELPTNHIPHYTEQLLFEIQMKDLIPIIVHPERNKVLLEQPARLYEFVRNGALTQITGASLVGKFGFKTKRFTQELIENNLTHFIASDAHHTKSRDFQMLEASQEIRRLYGQEIFYLLMENAQLLVDDQTIYVSEPQRIKRRKFFRIF
ncbi:tyrosine protein phosphatase [Amphibacillus sp. MSJ-3]|uniref:tyrosine-protein phosphatase n=1 Tax=Amphibacillus sp. MSJ-3 TaxID=2841505 RepID=UPI001C0ECF6C|nr:CpsB/CapC family capsule biosynthesis tyrosine phosphatase [Amphibacillus sp. MSJ-3]MBU5594388.1 tyrosine protein phosphatase [Amphibacillus sp. MSJ-3]